MLFETPIAAIPFLNIDNFLRLNMLYSGCLQAPYNKVTYSIIGDDKAPSLFSIDERGQVKVKSTLNEDDGEIYKVSLTFKPRRCACRQG